MAINWTSVFSSNVQEVGYDLDSQTLFIKWNSGKTSMYAGVPPDLAVECSKSWSVGTFLNEKIKPNFKHAYASE